MSTIASRFKKRDVLESILWPSKVIPDQYKSEMFEMKDGKVVSGVIVRENAANVFLRTADSPGEAGRRPEGGDRKSRGVDSLADARRSHRRDDAAGDFQPSRVRPGTTAREVIAGVVAVTSVSALVRREC